MRSAGGERKREFRSHRRRSGRIDTWGDNDENIIWGPYKMEFRKEILRRLLKAQLEVRRDGPDPSITLISADELMEIRRLWLTEEGDWEDSIPAIYEEVMGETLAWVRDAFGGSTAEEQALLRAVAALQRIGLLVQRGSQHFCHIFLGRMLKNA